MEGKYSDRQDASPPQSIVNNHSILCNLPCNVYYIDPDMKILKVNQVQASEHGLDAEELTGVSLDRLIPKEVVKLLAKNNQMVIESGKTKIFEEPFIDADELTHWYLSIKFPLYGERNKIIGTYGLGIDISQQEAAVFSEALAKIGFLGSSSKNSDLKKVLGSMEIDGVYISCTEKKCLTHLVKGQTAKEIARNLNVSPRTVEVHLANLRYKLNCRNKAELIIKVLENKVL